MNPKIKFVYVHSTEKYYGTHTMATFKSEYLMKSMCLTLIASSVMASCLYCVPYHSSVRSVCPSNDLETTATLKEKKKNGARRIVRSLHQTRHDTSNFSWLPRGKWAVQFCFYQITGSINRLGNYGHYINQRFEFPGASQSVVQGSRSMHHF